MCHFIDILELVQRSQLPKPFHHTELALPLLLLFRALIATAAQNEISQLTLWALCKLAPVAAALPPALPWVKHLYCMNTQGPEEYQMRCPGSSLQPSAAPVTNSAPSWQHHINVNVWVSFPSGSWAQGESVPLPIYCYIFSKNTLFHVHSSAPFPKNFFHWL